MPDSTPDGQWNDVTPSSDKTRKIIRATREVIVSINGEEYDALLIPRNAMVEVDFSQYPEDDPLRRERNIEVLTEQDLDMTVDFCEVPGKAHFYHLSKRGARRLLEAL